jgi:hypothetical protein
MSYALKMVGESVDMVILLRSNKRKGECNTDRARGQYY